MFKKISFAIIVLALSYNAIAQNKISGKIVDKSNSAAIEFANVTLHTSDSVFIKGAYSDTNGLFAMNQNVGNYILAVSYLGFETAYIPVELTDAGNNLGDIRLEASSIKLEGVTVTAQTVVNKFDRKLIMPSESQVKTSTSGIDLLKKMQLPRIIIDPMANNVTTAGNGEVQLRINGVLVTNAEIAALRPEDIVRIEYHDDSGARYGNAAAVLDYIIRRKNSGGNVNGNFQNNIFNDIGFAEDFFAAKLNHKKSEFSANADYRHRRIDWIRSNEETFVFPDQVLHRVEEGQPTLFKEHQLRTTFNYSLIETDKYYFNARLRYNIMAYPNAYPDRISKINTSDNPIPLSINDHSTDNSNTPALDLYYQRNLKNEQLLIFNVVGTHINSRTSRTYQEHRGETTVTDIYSHIRGKKYSVITQGIYERKLGQGKLSTGLKHTQSYTNNIYAGDVKTEVNMRQAETYGYAEYQGKKGKVGYMANIGVTRNYYSQGNKGTEHYVFHPSMRINYNPNDRLYFRYRVGVWNNTPSLSYMNDVQQDIDALQIRRGNPNLKTYSGVGNNISAGYNKGIFSADLWMNYDYQKNPIMETVFFEDGKFIRTYDNQKAWHKFSAEINFKIRPLKDNLSISFAPGFNRYVSIAGNYTHTHSNPLMRLSIEGNYKGFIASFWMRTPWNHLWGENQETGERFHLISLGYKKTNWSASLISMLPFSKTYKQQSRNLGALTPSVSRIFSENLANKLLINITYNFNFGRQVKGGDRRLNNADNDSGIMSGGKK